MQVCSSGWSVVDGWCAIADFSNAWIAKAELGDWCAIAWSGSDHFANGWLFVDDSVESGIYININCNLYFASTTRRGNILRGNKVFPLLVKRWFKVNYP